MKFLKKINPKNKLKHYGLDANIVSEEVNTYLQNQSFKIGENEDIDIQDIKKLFHVVENEKKNIQIIDKIISLEKKYFQPILRRQTQASNTEKEEMEK